MRFCIRDDDTSFFTSPEQLERAYGEITRWGPVSLATVPFHRAGNSKGVPQEYRNQGTVHPLHENRPLVEYLRTRLAEGRFEIMLHGYHHDEPHGRPEFESGDDLIDRVAKGRKYLEELLDTRIRVFVPPRNTIGRQGLRAIAKEGLHLGGVAGVRSGWPPLSPKTWALWLRLNQWRRRKGGVGVPWILDLGDHRELIGNAVTPSERIKRNEASLDAALSEDGVFCAATHYWELESPSLHAGEPNVGEHLRRLIDRVKGRPQVKWLSVGDVLTQPL